MISSAGGLRVYVATRPTDFWKGMDGLALLVQETMGLDSFSGAAFVCRAKRVDRIKVLVWDQTGIVLVHIPEAASMNSCAGTSRPRQAAPLMGTPRLLRSA